MSRVGDIDASGVGGPHGHSAHIQGAGHKVEYGSIERPRRVVESLNIEYIEGYEFPLFLLFSRIVKSI